MQTINARVFARACSQLQRIVAMTEGFKIASMKDYDANRPVPAGQKSMMKGHLLEFAKATDALDARVTRSATLRAIDKLKKRDGKVTIGEAVDIARDLESRFGDEASETVMLCISPSSAAMYVSKEPVFGVEVDNLFASASYDIDEAAKCLALGRGTAGVFHLMRAMEIAVQTLSAHLGIANVSREWGKLLSDMRLKIETKPAGAERDAWSESHANLYHVKQAWRNSTMHPKRTYSLDEAMDVFNATKAFYKHLVTLIPASTV